MAAAPPSRCRAVGTSPDHVLAAGEPWERRLWPLRRAVALSSLGAPLDHALAAGEPWSVAYGRCAAVALSSRGNVARSRLGRRRAVGASPMAAAPRCRALERRSITPWPLSSVERRSSTPWPPASGGASPDHVLAAGEPWERRPMTAAPLSRCRALGAPLDHALAAVEPWERRPMTAAPLSRCRSYGSVARSRLGRRRAMGASPYDRCAPVALSSLWERRSITPWPLSSLGSVAL